MCSEHYKSLTYHYQSFQERAIWKRSLSNDLFFYMTWLDLKRISVVYIFSLNGLKGRRSAGINNFKVYKYI